LKWKSESIGLEFEEPVPAGGEVLLEEVLELDKVGSLTPPPALVDRDEEEEYPEEED